VYRLEQTTDHRFKQTTDHRLLQRRKTTTINNMNFLQRLFCGSAGRSTPEENPEEINHVETKPTETTPEDRTGKKEHPYSKFGLNSPPKGENPQEPESATAMMIKDGFKKHTKKLLTEKSRVLYFLYGRGFFFKESRLKRIENVNSIIADKEALKRAVRLLDNDGDKDVTLEFQEQYRTLCKSLTRYFAQPGAFGIPVPTEDEALMYYFRFQTQGNCFLLAPCIFVSYLMQHRNVANAGAPMDLTKYLRHSFDDVKLHSYLAHDNGGDTVKELEDMLRSHCVKPSDSPTPHYLYNLPLDLLQKRKSDCSLEKRLELAGPGIVSDFKVHPNFGKQGCDVSGCGYMQYSGRYHAKGKFIRLQAGEAGEAGEAKSDEQIEVTLKKYRMTHEESASTLHPKSLESNFNAVHNEDEGAALNNDENAENESSQDGARKIEGTHAMVIIGGRYEGRKLWLLLQNWWTDMQLVEVSAEYLKNCGALITFAEQEIDFAPENERDPYSLNDSLFADANYFDRAEQKVDGLSHPTLDRANRCTTKP